MIRRIVLLISVLAVGSLALVIPAAGQEDFEPHPHMLVLGVEFDETGEPVAFKKCIDLAANQALPLTAHHEHMHFGTAGVALFDNAGHVAVPGAPFPAPFEDPVPWSNCEELIDFFFGA